MPEFCTCGAQLPPDALFCHKCGKPQRDIVEPEPPPGRTSWASKGAGSESAPRLDTGIPPGPAGPGPEGAGPAGAPLNFRNPVAVKIALLLALSATILSILPLVNWLAAGFFAVFFYRRKTGSLLNVGAGMRMGWITGLFSFAMFVIVFTLEELPAALSGQLATNIQDQVKNLPALDPMMAQQVVHMLGTGTGIAEYLLFSMAGLFFFITCFSIAGGALGAKLVGRG